MPDREWEFEGIRIRFSGQFPEDGIVTFFRQASLEYRKRGQFARMSDTIELPHGCTLFITSENYVGLVGERVADALLVAANELEGEGQRP